MRLPRRGAARAGPADLRKMAEEAAALLPPIMVAADRVAAVVAQGVHGRRRVGQGETFWQFRRYREGDPVQLQVLVRNRFVDPSTAGTVDSATLGLVVVMLYAQIGRAHV